MQPTLPSHGTMAEPNPKRRARWLLVFVTAMAMVTTAALGVWQLQRAATKEALARQIDERSKLAAIEDFSQQAVDNRAGNKNNAAGTAPTTDPQALLHRRVNLRGAWLHQHTAFLDNRFMAGRPGFLVVTPLQLTASAHVVWVQRGWVPRDPQDRTRLPDLAAPAGPVTVQGRMVAEVSRVYALGAPANAPASAAAIAPQTSTASTSSAARASRIWQNLPTVEFVPPTQLLPVAVLQTAVSDGADAQDGLLRDWPAQDSGVAKHYGYAFQWFALCGLIMVLYAWFQFVAPRRRKS
jgi:surfeit locus 1 family protein